MPHGTDIGIAIEAGPHAVEFHELSGNGKGAPAEAHPPPHTGKSGLDQARLGPSVRLGIACKPKAPQQGIGASQDLGKGGAVEVSLSRGGRRRGLLFHDILLGQVPGIAVGSRQLGLGFQPRLKLVDIQSAGELESRIGRKIRSSHLHAIFDTGHDQAIGFGTGQQEVPVRAAVLDQRLVLDRGHIDRRRQPGGPDQGLDDVAVGLVLVVLRFGSHGQLQRIVPAFHRQEHGIVPIHLHAVPNDDALEQTGSRTAVAGLDLDRGPRNKLRPVAHGKEMASGIAIDQFQARRGNAVHRSTDPHCDGHDVGRRRTTAEDLHF